MSQMLNFLDQVASKIDTHKDFDGVIAEFTAAKIYDDIKDKIVIEAGCSTGVVTERIIDVAKELYIVEGSSVYANIVFEKFQNRLAGMTISFFSDFHPIKRAEVVLLLNVLHHFENPVGELINMKDWLCDDGIMIITVPNMESLHRRLGVASGLTTSVSETSERNELFKQYGRYTKDILFDQVEAAGFEVVDFTGFFLKPFNHDVMIRLSLPSNVLMGLNKLGESFPELASQILVKVKKK